MTRGVAQSMGLAALAAIAASCGGGQPAETGPIGVADIQVGMVTIADVVDVKLTVSGTGIAHDIVRDLQRSGSGWRGIVGGVPAGDGRQFHGDAYDKYGNIIYTGDATATIAENQSVVVTLILQQKVAPQPFVNTVPFIDSVVASSSTVAPGDQIALGATGHDVDQGDVLTWSWTAAAGTFDAPATAVTKWTAPSTEGSYAVTVSLSDDHGGVRAVTLNVTVAYGYASGTAIVVADINTWPDIPVVTATPGRVDVGQASKLLATASDADGDPLTYAWTDDCKGTFSDPAAPDPTWNAPATQPPTGLCTLAVVVADGRGGHNTGTLTVQVGPTQSFDQAPTVLSTFQADDQATAGQVLAFSIEAIDPEGGALSFDWSASGGTLGTPVATAGAGGSTVSQVDWTAPTGAGPFTVTVVVSDPGGNQTTRAFSVNGAAATSSALDQSQLTEQAQGWYLALSPAQQVGQSVVVGRTGQLTGVEFSIVDCAAIKSASATVSLVVTNGNGAVLSKASRPIGSFASGCAPASLLPDVAGTGAFAIQPVAVTAGMTLNLTLSLVEPASTCAGGVCGGSSGLQCVTDLDCQDQLEVGENVDSYKPGAAFSVTNGTLISQPTYDLVFKTLVQ
jgi:hypothetical protein